jgi:hypothetical protein
MYKKSAATVLLVGLIGFGLLSSAVAQTPSADSSLALANLFKTDFTVPDAPAFDMLDTEVNEILRPSSFRELALAASDIGSSDKIPKMAIEFAPFMLLRGKSLTIKDYRARPWLYRMRVSIATAQAEDGTSASSLAIGLRGTITDDQDLRMNDSVITAATELATQINNLMVSEVKGPPGEDEAVGVVATPDHLKDKIAELEAEFRRQHLEPLAEAAAGRTWNARLAEYALAALFQSRDSSAENLQFQQFAAWYTSAWGFDNWGQLLIGARMSLAKPNFESEELDINATFSSRLYVGTNTAKVLAELLLSSQEDQKVELMFNAGGEARLTSGLWAEFTAGALHSGATKRAKLVTDFRLKYGL